MKKFIAFATASGAVLAPMLAFAQTGAQLYTILGIVQNIINIIIPILITAGIAYFIYGVVSYVSSKDEEKRKEARQIMIYGVIGLFVIVSIWGLIRSLGSATGVQQGGTGCIVNPALPGC
jgi:uncharacterized membrane protein YidH (DUF202 family)